MGEKTKRTDVIDWHNDGLISFLAFGFFPPGFPLPPLISCFGFGFGFGFLSFSPSFAFFLQICLL